MPFSKLPTSRRTAANGLIFLAGLLLTAGFYAAVEAYAPQDSLLVRYCCGHPIEYIEIGLFFWAITALAAKARDLHRQRAALHAAGLPEWTGQPVPVGEAPALLQSLSRLPRRLQDSLLVRRVRGALAFVCSRGSTEGLDDYLRSQAEIDADAVDGSYSLVRFITWAIPILGFLGTVLGITDAIANVTPEQLAQSLSGVTDGLTLAFDTTAIALGLSMGIMFFSFVLDRAEQGVLQAIDDVVEQQLAYRFERLSPEGGEFVALLRQQTGILVQALEQLVQRQSELWSSSMERIQACSAQAGKEQYEQLTAALRHLLEETLEAHQRQLAKLEEQTLAGLLQRFENVCQALRETVTAIEHQGQRAAEQAALLGQLLDGEQRIIRLQETLDRNLQALAGTGMFQQAVHSLTAAIHLLTASSWPAGRSPLLSSADHGLRATDPERRTAA